MLPSVKVNLHISFWKRDPGRATINNTTNTTSMRLSKCCDTKICSKCTPSCFYFCRYPRCEDLKHLKPIILYDSKNRNQINFETRLSFIFHSHEQMTTNKSTNPWIQFVYLLPWTDCHKITTVLHCAWRCQSSSFIKKRISNQIQFEFYS